MRPKHFASLFGQKIHINLTDFIIISAALTINTGLLHETNVQQPHFCKTNVTILLIARLTET